MPDKISPSNFAAKIKSKYPVYKDVEDNILVSKIIQKYPEYKDSIDMSSGIVKTQEQPVEDKPAKIPSFKEFAAQRGLSSYEYRAVAEGTRGPDLQQMARMDKEVAEAPERIKQQKKNQEEMKILAVKNTTEKNLKAQGIKYTEGDINWNYEKQKIDNLANSDELALTTDMSGNPVYKRKLGFWDSVSSTLNKTNKDELEAQSFLQADTRQKVKMADAMLGREEEAVPSFLGEVAGGAILPIMKATIGGMAGTAAAPVVGTAAGVLGSILAMSPDAYNVGYKNNAIKFYANEINEIKRKNGVVTDAEKEAAMTKATTQGVIGGATGVVEAAALVGIPAGNTIAGRGLKNAIVNTVKHSSLDAIKQGAVAAISEQARQTAGALSGYNTSVAESIKNNLEAGKSGFETGLAFSLYHAGATIPKSLLSSAKNYLSTIPRQDLNNLSTHLELNGVIPEGSTSKMNNTLDRFQKAKSKVPSIVSEDNMGSFAGLIEKKMSLEEQKKTTDPTFHAKIDEQISAIDERLKRMSESSDPIKEEVDDVTGDTGEAVPHTEEDVQRSIDTVNGKAPVVEKKTIEDLKPVIIINGKEYSGINHADAMFEAKYAGENIPDWRTEEGAAWREANGMFKDKEGNILTREEAMKKEGVQRSSDMYPVKLDETQKNQNLESATDKIRAEEFNKTKEEYDSRPTEGRAEEAPTRRTGEIPSETSFQIERDATDTERTKFEDWKQSTGVKSDADIRAEYERSGYKNDGLSYEEFIQIKHC